MIGAVIPTNLVKDPSLNNNNKVNNNNNNKKKNNKFYDELIKKCQSNKILTNKHELIIKKLNNKNELIKNYYDETIKNLEYNKQLDKLFIAYNDGIFALQILHLVNAKNLWNLLMNSNLWQNIIEKIKETQDLLAEFKNNHGWTIIRESQRFKTSYREENDKTTHSFRVCGHVQAPLLNLVSVLYEVDLFPLWFPFCKYGKELLSNSRFHKIINMEIFAPWPVANRELVCNAYGVNILESNQVVIFMRSIDKHPNIKLPTNTSAVRALIHFGGFLIEPISRTESKIQLLINTDPKLDNLPTSVLNWITGKLIHVILSQMEKAAKFDVNDEKNPYAQCLKNHKDIYDFVRETMEEYFNKNS